jgi:hypothetical protein
MSDNSFHSAAELVSLALTVPTVFLAIGVVMLWGPAAKDAIKSRPMTAEQWFITGVVVAFLGSVGDNVYWSIPWTASYTGSKHTDYLMSSGVYFNVVLRQTAGIIAAFCHLRAAQLTSASRTRFVNWLLVGSYIGAGVTAMILWLM